MCDSIITLFLKNFSILIHSKNEDTKMEEIEEIFQHCLNKYSVEKKRIPIEINRQKTAMAKDLEDYQKAIAENDRSLIRGYQNMLRDKEYELKAYEEKSSFLREPTKEDISYRWQQCEGFSQKVAQYADENEMLCFHGTDIFGAKHIIESGKISSGADRLGHATSFDPPGKISVTNKDTVDTSVKNYMSLIGDFLYPAGCLFVVKPKDKPEYDKLSSSGWMIDNVDFKENPDRLVAIVTTPENIERVSQWAGKGGIDSSKVMLFEKFVERCKSNSIASHGKMQTHQRSGGKELNI